MTSQQILTRYRKHVAFALENSSKTIRIPRGRHSVNTHCAYLRKMRKFYYRNPEKLLPEFDRAQFINWVADTKVWADDDNIFVGPKQTWDPFEDPQSSATGPSYAAVHNRNLTTEELQALFYCYDSNLIQESIKINSVDPDFHDLVRSFAAKCPNVGVVYEHDHIILV